MMTTAEPGKIFSRPVEIDRIPEDGLSDEFEADAQECETIRDLIGVVGVKECRVAFTIRPWRRQGFRVSGTVIAPVVYTCVVSLDDFEAIIEDGFNRYFLRRNAPGPRADIVTVDPLDDEEPDVLEGNAIDVGAIALETLALAVEAYPRKPGVTFAGSAGDEEETGEAGAKPSPFAVLERLKQPR